MLSGIVSGSGSERHRYAGRCLRWRQPGVGRRGGPARVVGDCGDPFRGRRRPSRVGAAQPAFAGRVVFGKCGSSRIVCVATRPGAYASQ